MVDIFVADSFLVPMCLESFNDTAYEWKSINNLYVVNVNKVNKTTNK